MTEILLIAGIIATIWVVIGLAKLFYEWSNGSAWYYFTCTKCYGPMSEEKPVLRGGSGSE